MLFEPIGAASPDQAPGAGGAVLVSVGHGTLGAGELALLLRTAGLDLLVDVRSAPGSRRHPQFGREQMSLWLGEAGIGYRHEPRLGGFRRARPDSPNVVLRHPSFRGYADYMSTPEFRPALDDLVDAAGEQPTCMMCSETLWWRCHRRLIADAAILLLGVDVLHLWHDGRLTPHHLTEGVRMDGRGGLVYDQVETGRQIGGERPSAGPAPSPGPAPSAGPAPSPGL